MRDSNKPLDVLTVKRHKEGMLVDAPLIRASALRSIRGGLKHGRIDIALEMVGCFKLNWVNIHLWGCLMRGRHSLSKELSETPTEMIEHNRELKGANEARKAVKDLVGKRLQDVSVQELHAHILAVRAKTPDIARRFRAGLKAAWEYSVSTGKPHVFCPINTHVDGKIKQGRRERERVLSDGELKLVLPWMSNYPSTIAEESDGWWITIPAERMKKGVFIGCHCLVPL